VGVSHGCGGDEYERPRDQYRGAWAWGEKVLDTASGERVARLAGQVASDGRRGGE
jgi:hypothetical protein